MNQMPFHMSTCNMIGATEQAKAQVKRRLELAAELDKDSRKQERLLKNECKACFYSYRVGGSAMVTRPCMSCGTDQVYGSTATDVLCKECAKKHSLCRHCGGDLEMRVRRKEWPEPDKAI